MAGRIALFLGIAVYCAVAAVATLIYPPALALFLAPLAVAVAMVGPAGRALPRVPMMNGLIVATFLLAIWPVYLHVKIGPLPILTPPRLTLYALTFLWLYDLTRSAYRRAQLVSRVRRKPFLSSCVAALILLSLASLPFSEGRAVAVPEFARQVMIWFLPLGMAATYMKSLDDLQKLLKALTLAGATLAAIAVVETATGTLLASALSPLISDSAEWLRMAQSQKIRDGVFRAQAIHTHPLSLGEFLSLIAPFAIAFSLGARGAFARTFWLLIALLIIGGVGLTSSRAAFLGLGAALGVMATLLALRFLANQKASPLRPLIGLGAALTLLGSPVAGYELYQFVSGAGGESASNSSQARVAQIEQAWPKIMKRPATGYGVGRSTRILGYWGLSLTIDNYFLSLALDIGLLGPVAFILMLIAIARDAEKNARLSTHASRFFFMAFVASMLSFILCRSVMSLTFNLNVIYIVVGAYLACGSLNSRPARTRRQS